MSSPDDLFRAADALTGDLGIPLATRNATAAARHLARRRDEQITALLDQVYREQPTGLGPELRRAQGRSLRTEEW